ncbi:MAG: DUF2845 domain-containing protein [Steroidobacteraceae bacterium]
MKSLRRMAVVAAGLALTAPAYAFRCGNYLVHEGDSRGEVAAKCGEPADVSRRTILRAPISWYYGRPIQVGNGLVEIPVETWIYNLGPYRLMRQVKFEDGLVVEIETLGYGYNP